jgi:pimeloyl-ACP methyl ester carboxylesterase
VTWAIATLVLTIFVGAIYLALAVSRSRVFALDDSEVEQILVPLPTPGHHVSITHHPPKHLRFRTPLILCHGLAVNRFNIDLFDDGRGSDRTSLARSLSREGFDVWCLELRGRGRAKVPAGADWSIDDEVREDVPAAISTVLDRTGADRVLWVGHSKGGFLQILFQARGHPLASKVAGLVAIGSPGTLQYQRRWLRFLVLPGKLLLAIHGRIPLRLWAPVAVPIASLIHWAGRRFDPVIAANDGPALTRILASLPADISRGVALQLLSWVAREDGALSTLDGQKDEFSRLSLPMLLIAGEKDYLVPPRAVAYVKEHASSKDVTFLVLEGYGHGDLVVGTHAPNDVFPLVARWLEARADLAQGGQAAV